LNTWIDEEEFKDVVNGAFPEDKCTIPNAPEKPAAGLLANAQLLAGAAQRANNGPKPNKHLELRRIRISDGYASYFLDQTDHFLLA